LKQEKRSHAVVNLVISDLTKLKRKASSKTGFEVCLAGRRRGCCPIWVAARE
jgi:hypothetical protein